MATTDSCSQAQDSDDLFPIVGAVLCGGRSSRLGTDKFALRHPNGSTLLQHACGRLAALTSSVAVVGGGDVDPDFLALPDAADDQGPVAGIVAALRWAKSQNAVGCLVTPVDMPGLTVADLAALLGLWERNASHPACLVHADDERVQPLVGVYPVAAIDQLQALLHTPHRSLSRWLNQRSFDSLVLPADRMININRPQDWQAFLQSFRSDMNANLRFQTPGQAIDAVADRLSVVAVDPTVDDVCGRVLASDVTADRDSPAADVSAMDGYALREEDRKQGVALEISGHALPGSPPPRIAPGCVVKIFTGAVVPDEADLVIRREDVIESEHSIVLADAAMACPVGANIRRAGENVPRGGPVLSRGQLIRSPQRAALENFGVDRPTVYRRVRVTVITTGDELVIASQVSSAPLQPWQIRNSNQAALIAALRPHRWIDLAKPLHAIDDPETLRQTVDQAIQGSDAVLLTGGVSAGDHDYVPAIVRQLGADVIFHKLPIRPGKPIFAAVSEQGKLIVGLPGNPVSATMGCRRFVQPWLSKMAGIGHWKPSPPSVRLQSPGTKTLPLHWMRGVRVIAPGLAVPVVGRGSGDLVALGQTDGFVELPPDASGEGPWPFFDWA
ncbi:NTP transferase domain-containing protein [Crateriforma conspicua]|uniref:Probable molybdenum cofactor guanylyltransferase n=1 Tax=Crateriforma conspicua TaxID=2527996 RepID=A0A5C5XRI0_9PLAN|nr:molybdopterin-binding protein [Crateriforma conspicua]TWT65837.1 Molybdopterin molybdenumtransferase [Crateriforma conspicua]